MSLGIRGGKAGLLRRPPSRGKDRWLSYRISFPLIFGHSPRPEMHCIPEESSPRSRTVRKFGKEVRCWPSYQALCPGLDRLLSRSVHLSASCLEAVVRILDDAQIAMGT
jgi:hypothetical protein